MATNDNRAMVEAARESAFSKAFDAGCKITTGNYFGSNTDEKTRVMFISIWDSALEYTSQQSALAVAAERTRIAAELSIAYPGKGHDGTWLINFIDKLRGATDE